MRVYLDGNAAFAAVQEMAKATGENLAITQRSLWTRMYERGLLLDVQKEAGKVRMSPKRTIAGGVPPRLCHGQENYRGWMMFLSGESGEI